MHQPHSHAVYFAVCTTGFDTPFLSTCMKKGGCMVLIGKNRHGFHPNLNDVLQIILRITSHPFLESDPTFVT